MLKQILILLCEKVIQDKNGKISYIDCFDVINAGSLPVKVGSFCVCSQWRKIVPGDFYGRAKLTIRSPNGEETIIVQDELIIKSNTHRLNIDFKDGFIFPWEGVYTFELCISKSDKSWEEVFTTDLNVVKGELQKTDHNVR